MRFPHFVSAHVINGREQISGPCSFQIQMMNIFNSNPFWVSRNYHRTDSLPAILITTQTCSMRFDQSDILTVKTEPGVTQYKIIEYIILMNL